MGYTTEFEGSVSIDPPLNQDEVSFLLDFSGTRRMLRKNGPLFVKGTGYAGQNNDADVIESNYSDEAEGQPGLWCQWVCDQAGSMIEWNGGEKFYDAEEWMKYLIDALFSSRAHVYIGKHIGEDPRLKSFSCDHVFNGVIEAQGEEQGDVWRLVVENNKVSRQSARLVWDE